MDSWTECNSFVSVECAGIILRTPTVPASISPSWNTKLSFPIFYPILNDKIVVRIWDQNKFSPDKLISCIPERPTDNDWFNVSKL